jgi:hypothetical protein
VISPFVLPVQGVPKGGVNDNGPDGKPKKNDVISEVLVP